MVKKLVDTGALRAPELFDFLSTSTGNIAVISDYVQMESFKGVGLVNLQNGLKIISKFPKQVAILKSTPKIILLNPRGSGLQRRFIDELQTGQFEVYCKKILSYSTDPFEKAYDTTRKEIQSKAHFASLTKQMREVREGMIKLFRSYGSDDLRSLRKNERVSDSFADRITNDILLFTGVLFRSSDKNKELPLVKDTFFSLQFRFALCSYILALKWASDGGIENVHEDKLRNDYIDMMHAAYATFFDGIITKDKKLHQIYQQAAWMLQNIF
jgi:hypothetical protein